MSNSVKGFFEVIENIVHILLLLEILLTQDSKEEGLFLVLLPSLNPFCSSAIISFAWGLILFKMTFSMIFLE